MASNGEKFLFFLIGGFVGASVALLFAPKSGQETRQMLGEKYRTGTEGLSRRVQAGREYIAETAHGLTERVTETIEKGKEAVLRQKDQVASAIEAGKKAYQEEKSKLEGSGEIL
ncbi:MAG: YtxH domain-containing protein [Acidobacteriota bacterium]